MVRFGRDRGAAAVEFALVLPLLVTIVIGIMEFGRAYNVQATMTAAARQGARIMALQHDTSTATTAVQSTASPYTVTAAQISATGCTGTLTATSTATVTVSYPLTLLTTFFGTTITITGKGVMRCNG